MNPHYLYFADNFDSEELALVGDEKIFDFSTFAEQSNVLLHFANLYPECQKERGGEESEELEKIRTCFSGTQAFETLREYNDKVRKELMQLCGELVTNILLLDLEQNISDPHVDDYEEILNNCLDNACRFSDAYCTLLCVTSYDEVKRKKLIDNTLFNTNSNNIFKLSCYPLLAKSNLTGKLTTIFCYEVSSLEDALKIFFVIALIENTAICNCRVCKKYFIPTSRRSEIYCEKCRDFNYEDKVEDEARKAYRSIYKTQTSRKIRNTKNIPDIDERFKRWRKFAKAQLAAYDKKDIDLDTMKQVISSDSWMYCPIDEI